MKKIQNYLLDRPLLVLLLGLLTYTPLFFGYYQQDEWLVFSSYKELNHQSLFQAIGHYFTPQSGQFIPLAQIFAHSIYRIFDISYLAYLIIGLLLHLMVGYLFYKLTRQLSADKNVSLLAALLFLIAPHHFQATAWVMSNVGYTWSAIFLLIGLSAFYKWLEINKLKYAVFASLALLTSLLFKEITVYIFLLLPLMAYLWKKRLDIAAKSILISLPGLTFTLWHLWYLRNHPLDNFSVSYTPTLLNLVTLPLRSLVQSILPQHFIYDLSTALLFLLPPYNLEKLQTTAFNQQVESAGALAIVLIFSTGFAYLTKIVFQKTRKQTVNKRILPLFLTGCLLTLCSGLPYIFLDSKTFSLLQPRYVYLGIISISLCYAALLLLVKNHLFYKATLILMVILAVTTFNTSLSMGREGLERLNILQSIQAAVPPGIKTTVIYVQSDSSFYGLPNDTKVLPFQLGPGKILALYLKDQVYIPQEVYLQDAFYKIDSQGYYPGHDGGWGYFRDYQDLLNSVKQNQLDVNSVYSFDYFSQTRMIENTTSEIRSRLSSDLAI